MSSSLSPSGRVHKPVPASGEPLLRASRVDAAATRAAYAYARKRAEPHLSREQRRRLGRATKAIWREASPVFREEVCRDPAVLALALRRFGLFLMEAESWTERFIGALNAERGAA